MPHDHGLHLEAWSKELERRRCATTPNNNVGHIKEYFDVLEWKRILKPIPAYCIKNGRHWLPSCRQNILIRSENT